MADRAAVGDVPASTFCRWAPHPAPAHTAPLLVSFRPSVLAPPRPAPPRGGDAVAASPVFSWGVQTLRCQLHFVVVARRSQLGFVRCHVASFVFFGLDALAKKVRLKRKRARCQDPFSVPGELLVVYATCGTTTLPHPHLHPPESP